MNKKLVLLGAGLLLTAATASAQKQVSGKVTDSHGDPVVGASVRVAGTKLVTTTDASGNFTLKNVPASAKHLHVSYIGMQAETVSVAGNVKVVLKDNELGEAVVVGYGTGQKVGTVVGSLKKVGGEAIAAKPAANIADALQGKVAGLEILNNTGDIGDINSTSIRLRGVGSLGASSTPLIIVDGAPASTAVFNMLNDRDIESVTTLKDASATSIYGSRAANGVIYITTKKGRTNEKAQVNISQRVGWSQLANGIGNPMNANELLEYQLENGIITVDEYTLYKNHGANTNWQRYYFDNAAPSYNTDFSIRGGSGKTTYFVSASYMKQNSLTKVSHFDRYTLRSNIESQPKDWLMFGIKQNVTYTDRESDEYTNREYSGYVFNNNVTGAMMAQPYWDPYYDKDKHLIWPNEDLYDFQWIQTLRPEQINDIIYNGVAYLQLTPVKGLTIKSQLGLYATDTRRSANINMNMPNVQTGSAVEQHNRSSLWTITNTAEYKFDLGKNHSFTLLAGQEGVKGTGKGFGVSGLGYTDNRTSTIGNVTEAKIPTYSSDTYEYLSFFGRVDYALMGKYFVNFTFRNDQSSRFGRDNRSANFLSGGVMWRVSDEAFMAETKGWLSDLQLKVSVGSTGNSEIGNYASLGLVGNTMYMGNPGWVVTQPSNNQLGWEKQIQTNVGISARFFDRVDVDLNIYHKKTLDMLMRVPLPYTTGFSSQMLNVGELSNRGVELELGYDVLRGRDYFLHVYANYSYNRNKVDKLFYGLDEWEMPDYGLKYTVGKSLQFFEIIYAGVDKEDGAPMYYKPGNKGGIVHEFNPETMTKTYSDALNQDTGKNLYAPHNGGFGLSAGWKGITVAADFSFVLGKYMLNNDYAGSVMYGNAKAKFNQSRDVLKRWQKPGDISVLPGKDYGDDFVNSSFKLENASFLRLKNLTVAYDLPKRWMQATNFIENVRFSFTGRNIFTVTKYRGCDPEPDTNVSSGLYPATRQFTLGIDVTF